MVVEVPTSDRGLPDPRGSVEVDELRDDLTPDCFDQPRPPAALESRGMDAGWNPDRLVGQRIAGR